MIGMIGTNGINTVLICCFLIVAYFSCPERDKYVEVKKLIKRAAYNTEREIIGIIYEIKEEEKLKRDAMEIELRYLKNLIEEETSRRNAMESELTYLKDLLRKTCDNSTRRDNLLDGFDKAILDISKKVDNVEMDLRCLIDDVVNEKNK